jgi:hypothetical protein
MLADRFDRFLVEKKSSYLKHVWHKDYDNDFKIKEFFVYNPRFLK